MSFEKAIETSLASALGDDHALVAELRDAFVGSARRHLNAMGVAKGTEDWRDAALRLKGLAASFGADALMRDAAHAANAAPGDRDLLTALDAGLSALGR